MQKTPWRVGVSLVLKDESAGREFVEGREIPRTIVSNGTVYVDAWNLESARTKALDFIRFNYDVWILSFGFYNTEPCEIKRESEMPGLTAVVKEKTNTVEELRSLILS